jgi:hypothetical protein
MPSVLGMPGAIVGAEQLAHRLADRGGRIDAKEIRQVIIDEDAASLFIGRADHRGHGADHKAQQLGAGVKRLLVEAIGGAQLLFECEGALADDFLLAAQGQEIARAGAELMMVDRA